MVRVILALLAIGVTIYGLIDCLRSSDDEAQLLPRQVWCLITLVPLVGSVAWLVFGRVAAPDLPSGLPSVVAPDDDPEFLHSLDRGFRERRRRAAEDARQRRRQEEARRREAAEREAQRSRSDGGKTNGGTPDGEHGRPGDAAPTNRPDGEDHSG